MDMLGTIILSIVQRSSQIEMYGPNVHGGSTSAGRAKNPVYGGTVNWYPTWIHITSQRLCGGRVCTLGSPTCSLYISLPSLCTIQCMQAGFYDTEGM